MTQEEKVCPFMTRPVPRTLDNWGAYYDMGEIHCQVERCAAWETKSVHREGFCKLIREG